MGKNIQRCTHAKLKFKIKEWKLNFVRKNQTIRKEQKITFCGIMTKISKADSTDYRIVLIPVHGRTDRLSR